ncbi:MAG: putative lipid II flippase FtsW [Candidatus Anoxychlamydiales bacterium]|nr:putative lipid II flippase FtsW [Candidatus Anoxychlamydiales bacterium]
MNKRIVVLIACALIIFSIGLVMVFNTTSAEVLNRSLDKSTTDSLVKQILYGFIGIIIGFIVYYFGYNSIIKYSQVYLIIGSILLLLVFVPYIGHSINGANRWIGLFGFTIQPSEFMKYIIPIFFIHRALKYKGSLELFNFIKALFFLVVPMGLILLEPDTGTTIIILVCLMLMFFITKVRLLYWALPLLFLTSLGSIAAYNMPHVPDRIRVYLNPELDLRGKGHQPYQSKIAVGSGGIFGRGLGESLQKLDYLPEARNDYIAAIYAEEMGFVGICLLIFLYMCIAYSGFYIAFNAIKKEGFYLATFLTFLLTFQAFLNLGVVSGLLPPKGITLPFFSQGGTSLIVNIIAIFLLLSIATDESIRYKRCKVKR